MNGMFQHLILFDEQLQEQFPGFSGKVSFGDLPMWGNFTVRDVLSLSITGTIHHTIFSISNHSDVVSLKGFLRRSPLTESLIIGRTGNITVLDWGSIPGDVVRSGSIVKVQVGKVLSDLYLIGVEDLQKAVDFVEQRLIGDYRGFVHLFFDDYLFHNFERVVKVPGFSYLLRNSMEYFHENHRFAGYFQNKWFCNLFLSLQTSLVSNTTVAEHGFVKNSFIGAGVKVDGVVENSTVFHDVVVGRGARVQDSVILPSNILEEGAAVENALVLSGNGRMIGRNSVVGGHSNVRNADYPSILKKGLTIVGEDVPVPPGSRIGSGCLVVGQGSGVQEPLLLSDGETCRLPAGGSEAKQE